MIEPLSVSQINEQIKSLLESTFLQVRIEGEVSRVTYHSSGHLYFTLKDAKSALSCVMFRSNASRLAFRLEEGQHVIASGSISVYVPRGSYQLMVATMEPYGVGALALAFEQLKKKLASEGLFDAYRKKPIPKRIRHIAIVTSKTGAAIEDMKRVAAKRWPMLKITLVDTLVQGGEAAQELARHIAYADRLGADVMVVGRGGGSLEDLWAFNEEIVARAIADAKTPVVSAVGHEVDTLISDFVADMRAPTPSAAMEQILPDRMEVLLTLDEWMERMRVRMRQLLSSKEERLDTLVRQMAQHAIDRKIALRLEEVSNLQRQLKVAMKRLLDEKEKSLDPVREGLVFAKDQAFLQKEQQWRTLLSQIQSLDPRHKLRPGFVQLVKEDKPVGLDHLRIGDRVKLEDGHIIAEATIEKVRSMAGDKA